MKTDNSQLPEIGEESFNSAALWLPVPIGIAIVVPSVDEIPIQLRQTAFGTQPQDFRYYELLEKIEKSSSTQFECRFLLMQDAASGEWAIQPLFLINHDLLPALPLPLWNLINVVRNFWPGFLTIRMLMIGCAAAEGHLDHTQPWVFGALREALNLYRKKVGASIILYKDFLSGCHLYPDCLGKDGY